MNFNHRCRFCLNEASNIKPLMSFYYHIILCIYVIIYTRGTYSWFCWSLLTKSIVNRLRKKKSLGTGNCKQCESLANSNKIESYELLCSLRKDEKMKWIEINYKMQMKKWNLDESLSSDWKNIEMYFSSCKIVSHIFL